MNVYILINTLSMFALCFFVCCLLLCKDSIIFCFCSCNDPGDSATDINNENITTECLQCITATNASNLMFVARNPRYESHLGNVNIRFQKK